VFYAGFFFLICQKTSKEYKSKGEQKGEQVFKTKFAHLQHTQILYWPTSHFPQLGILLILLHHS